MHESRTFVGWTSQIKIISLSVALAVTGKLPVVILVNFADVDVLQVGASGGFANVLF